MDDIMKILASLLLISGFGLVACQSEQASAPSASGATGETQLSVEILHSDPSLSGPRLSRPKISPDGRMVSVLQGRDDDATQQDLWSYDLQTGQGKVLVSSTDLLGAPEVLSAEEKNRRERARIRGKGIVSYSWDEKGEQILFPLGGDVYTYNLVDQTAHQITDTEGFETDARISQSGRYVSYVRGNELYIADMQRGGRERQLSYGATDLIRNATASFVVQEELARSTGYWMSPNETHIAYSQIDESPVAIEERIEFGANGIENVAQRYPFAGTDNVTVKLGVVSIKGGRTKWVDLGNNPDIYLARVYWSLDGSTLYVGILSRDHKSFKMLEVNPLSAQSRLLFEETSSTWINVRGGFNALEDGGFLWSSERDGFRHIYRYAKDGTAQQITKGNWPVSRVECVDEDTQTIYFSGWQDTPLERHIFKVGFDGTGMTQLSKGAGVHGASFAKNCSAYIGTFSNTTTPPQTRVFDNKGEPLIWLNENALDDAHPYAPYRASHVAPQFGQLEADDGTKMDYVLYKPTDIKPGERRPAITLVYGGPGVQRVSNAWGNLFAQLLVDKGFVVFQLDNRGATNRGKEFEDYLYRSMGNTEVKDQSVGAEFLKRLRFVDPERMGIYGWSYGGYMTLHMLAQTNHYQVGVSGAPVTDWALYDTAYTERYLGNPNETDPNYTKGAYETASVFAHIDGLTEPFLLIHGMADDNVVFRHSIKLMAEMQQSGRHNMRVMTYPGEKHGFRNKANQIHRDQEILNFFTAALQPE
ncbi:MAG TPA: S9 family peptidase [Hellea balneolensis]|uniref:S9 family peptidase n=1 Tax=Hellea balneolensis TaxID=287478 RepID=A0A7C3G4Q8_9PROT|nr:S9 family peptidase [Hellea balneolensis]